MNEQEAQETIKNWIADLGQEMNRLAAKHNKNQQSMLERIVSAEQDKKSNQTLPDCQIIHLTRPSEHDDN